MSTPLSTPSTSVLPAGWAELEAAVNGRTTVGQIGVRDPESPCESYRPRPGARPFAHVSEADVGPWNKCETDGHYMCVECLEISIEALRGREDRCRECGTPLVMRGHERIAPTRCPRCEPIDLEERKL